MFKILCICLLVIMQAGLIQSQAKGKGSGKGRGKGNGKGKGISSASSGSRLVDTEFNDSGTNGRQQDVNSGYVEPPPMERKSTAGTSSKMDEKKLVERLHETAEEGPVEPTKQERNSDKALFAKFDQILAKRGGSEKKGLLDPSTAGEERRMSMKALNVEPMWRKAKGKNRGT